MKFVFCLFYRFCSQDKRVGIAFVRSNKRGQWWMILFLGCRFPVFKLFSGVLEQCLVMAEELESSNHQSERQLYDI